VILNLVNAKRRRVTLQQVQAAAKVAGGVRKGDIVFCEWDRLPTFNRPLRWLVEQGMKMMGWTPTA